MPDRSIEARCKCCWGYRGTLRIRCRNPRSRNQIANWSMAVLRGPLLLARRQLPAMDLLTIPGTDIKRLCQVPPASCGLLHRPSTASNASHQNRAEASVPSRSSCQTHLTPQSNAASSCDPEDGSSSVVSVGPQGSEGWPETINSSLPQLPGFIILPSPVSGSPIKLSPKVNNSLYSYVCLIARRQTRFTTNVVSHLSKLCDLSHFRNFR
jgi:hypothetical protein